MGQGPSSTATTDPVSPLDSPEMVHADLSSHDVFLDNILAYLSAGSTATSPPPSAATNPKEAAVEHAIADLVARLKAAESSSSAPSSSKLAPSAGAGARSVDWKAPITPDFTPPVSSKPANSNFFCPTCGRAPTDAPMARSASGFPSAATVVIPPGPLTAAAFESDASEMSAAEELYLLKAQVQDVARVCKVS